MSAEPPPGGGVAKAPPPTEWVEIIEPRSGEHMYANLTTGECVWDPPVGVAVKKTNDNQWWELFDQNTSRFYYYNATSQTTVWHRPADCDIIPLAKLQTLKQNTEVKPTTSPTSDLEDAASFETLEDKSLSPGKRRLKKQVQKHRRKVSEVQTENAVPLARLLPTSSSTEAIVSTSSFVQTSPLPSPRLSSSARRRSSHRHFHHHHVHPQQQPTRGLAKQLSLEGESFKKFQQKHPTSAEASSATMLPQPSSSSSSSIARSVSFMSKRSNAYDNYAPIGWKTGRSSVESTPKSSRKQLANGSKPKSPPQERPMAASFGHGTPLNSRKSTSSQKQSPNPTMSISELVDSGLTTLGHQHSNNGGAASSGGNSKSMSPLQAYILEQAKLSGYDVDDRDSYVESDVDSRHVASDSDDFADDEGCSDNLSKTSSSVEDDYLNAEPMYNNLEAMWRQNQHQQKKREVDAFSQEFDLRMKIAGANARPGTNSHTNGSNSQQRTNHNSSTMPRPASIQPTVHQHQHQQNYPVPYDVLHPSLQRNAHSLMVDPMALQKAAVAASTSAVNHSHLMRGPSSLSVTASMEADMEKYAQDNFNVQKRGLFRKRLSIKAILSWTTEGINKPLTCLPNEEKSAKKEAVQTFRLIQIYMGDRKAKPDMTINSVAFDITTMGYNKPSLRDEIFVQLCKQTTDNPKKDSLRRGWELMAICLAFFPPSATFAPFLQGYIAKHRDPSLDEYPDAHKWPIHIQISHYAGICAKRLERIGDGGRLRPKKPSIEDIDQSRLLIFRPSMFGGTLGETMEVQRDRFPHLRLPWILTTVADQILRLNGTGTEGIFRIPADFEEVMSLKSRFDQWEVVMCRDSHTAASLLKTWLRELYEPVIPDHFYDECIALAVNLDKESATLSASEKAKRLSALLSRMPELNVLVLMYLIRFLQLFAQSQISSVTKMDDSNLATVFAPNFLRCPSMDPLVIMENARKEMSFVKYLIQHLDTSIAEGIL